MKKRLELTEEDKKKVEEKLNATETELRETQRNLLQTNDKNKVTLRACRFFQRTQSNKNYVLIP